MKNWPISAESKTMKHSRHKYEDAIASTMVIIAPLVFFATFNVLNWSIGDALSAAIGALIFYAALFGFYIVEVRK